MTPEQTLVEKATVPEFFAKVAAETGVSPHDAAAARSLRVLGDQVAAGVDRYLEKLAAARSAGQDNLIKAAAAAADIAVGILPSTAPSPTDPTKVAADVEAYEAALAILKQAAAGTETLTPEIPGEDDGDEKAKKNPAVEGAAAAPVTA